MRIKVTKNYTDKGTRLVVEAGSVLDAPDERAAELIAKGVAAKDVGQDRLKKEEGGSGACPEMSGQSAESPTKAKLK